MIDEKFVKLETRLAAIELVLARIMAAQLMLLSDEAFEEVLRTWSEAADGMSFPGVPPELADLWSQELADSLRSILSIVRETRAQRRR